MIELSRSEGGVEMRMAEGLDTLLASATEWLESVGRPGVDPAADRLTPHAYVGDTEADAEFKRLMLPELDAGRAHDRQVYADVLARAGQGGVVLDDGTLFSLLRVLDETRLVVAARLGVDSDDWEASPRLEDSDDLHLYNILGWVQDALIHAASSGLSDPL